MSMLRTGSTCSALSSLHRFIAIVCKHRQQITGMQGYIPVAETLSFGVAERSGCQLVDTLYAESTSIVVAREDDMLRHTRFL
jgi:hypothetical protein